MIIENLIKVSRWYGYINMQMVISYEKHRAAPQGLTKHVGQAVGFALTSYKQLHRPCQPDPAFIPALPLPSPNLPPSALKSSPQSIWMQKVQNKDENAKH